MSHSLSLYTHTHTHTCSSIKWDLVVILLKGASKDSAGYCAVSQQAKSSKAIIYPALIGNALHWSHTLVSNNPNS